MSAENKKWDGKTRGGVLGYKIFLKILRIGKFPFAYFILYFVALYFCIFAPRASKSHYQYFRSAHNFGVLKSIIGVYKSFYVFGQSILDKVGLIGGVKHNFTFDHSVSDILYKVPEQGKGALLISAHIGNYEIAGHFLTKLDVPINVLMFDGEDNQIKEYLEEEVMQEKRFNTIYLKEDRSHLFKMAAAMRNNEFICLHGDRFLDQHDTLTTDFFGKEARFPKGPFELAQRFDIPYVFVYAVKTSKYSYKFLTSNPKISSDKPEQILKEYVSNLEEVLKEYPYQWFNYYPFWDK